MAFTRAYVRVRARRKIGKIGMTAVWWYRHPCLRNVVQALSQACRQGKGLPSRAGSGWVGLGWADYSFKFQPPRVPGENCSILKEKQIG